MRRFVVNATDRSDYYAFFMPIVCHIWKTFVGYEPLALLHGSEAAWRSTPLEAYVLGLIREYSQVCYVPDVPGFKTSTAMQISRLFGHVIPEVRPDDYVMTSDVDMVPLDASYFSQADPSFAFSLYGADAYGDIARGEDPPKFPMCYIGGRASSWRGALGTTTTDVHGEVCSALRGRADSWFNDENYFAEKLKAHPFYQGPLERIGAGRFRKGQCEFIARTWLPLARKRLDRADWRSTAEEGLIDCHAYRPGYESTDVLFSTLKSYFPGSADFFDSYLSRFLELKRAPV